MATLGTADRVHRLGRADLAVIAAAGVRGRRGGGGLVELGREDAGEVVAVIGYVGDGEVVFAWKVGRGAR